MLLPLYMEEPQTGFETSSIICQSSIYFFDVFGRFLTVKGLK